VGGIDKATYIVGVACLVGRNKTRTSDFGGACGGTVACFRMTCRGQWGGYSGACSLTMMCLLPAVGGWLGAGKLLIRFSPCFQISEV
jgi:hypothetical protein